MSFYDQINAILEDARANQSEVKRVVWIDQEAESAALKAAPRKKTKAKAGAVKRSSSAGED